VTAYAIIATTFKPRLALVSLFVLAAHALLLVGLQRIHTVPVAGVAPIFLVRTIVPESPQAALAEPATTVPAPLPQRPKPTPHPAPPAPALSADEKPAAAAQPRERAAPAGPEPFPTVRLPRPAQIAYQAVATQNGRMTALPSTIDWRHDGQSYDLRWTLDSPAVDDRGHHAVGQVTARGLVPSATDDPVPPGAQDPRVWIELGIQIARNPAQYLPGSRIMDFTVVGDNDIAGAGQFEDQPLPALHLVHEPVTDQDVRIELWLGKLFDYLPVGLLVIRPDGGRVEMVMRGIKSQATAKDDS
jgi:hypothetical protein